ncbi:hypothetical protein [Methylobacterium radiotolerans]|uniref:Uncharacterized protein n=1 Tax=Methylobacterium radiotolerans (strain ATCC 27329 / DSM 1819 / JCM 2831 / NBRC 15690 / NCIMB 10815 / 0-1) TaxID=426355 RepID=B1M1R2_METRJ|nr:hypothetical protein [Methylobacterium radiotolerans]ACB27645.1 hypothetical protein Mrad2831_5700 [Methylobacterium radiotolerans JCM 2831]GEM95911.1 hypothetical protein MRA01_04510 [Methylobacterium radiotolerans]
MPRLCAAILLAGIAAAALRRPAKVSFSRLATPDDVRVSAERLTLLFGDMPSRAVH